MKNLFFNAQIKLQFNIFAVIKIMRLKSARNTKNKNRQSVFLPCVPKVFGTSNMYGMWTCTALCKAAVTLELCMHRVIGEYWLTHFGLLLQPGGVRCHCIFSADAGFSCTSV